MAADEKGHIFAAVRTANKAVITVCNSDGAELSHISVPGELSTFVGWSNDEKSNVL